MKVSKNREQDKAVASEEDAVRSESRRAAVGKLVYASPVIAGLLFGAKNSGAQPQIPCSQVPFPTNECP